MEKKLNLYQKLIEMRKQVLYLQKGTKGFNFQYANEAQILSAIRDTMDHLSVFLEIDMISLETVACSYISKEKGPIKIDGLKATFEFKWTDAENPSDTIKKTMIVQDAESIIKTVGGLMTYANRYFLYKFFCVATDKADPDAYENNFKKYEEEKPAEDLTEKPTLPFNPEFTKPEMMITFAEAEILDKEIAILIAPTDPGYRERALRVLNKTSFEKLPVSELPRIKSNIAKKISDIRKSATKTEKETIDEDKIPF